ncbi:hypothetical protein IBT49_27030 [Erwinia sp. S63]|uniref:hypothetical protein n=1 Tax=Erwinia sp. S63 TaxID=2769341 RepID=UPI00190D8A06|nr:hypothetical protein [Erwinia sp. S63]
MNIKLTLAVLASSFLLSGCSALLPLNYKSYSGQDAATLVIQQREEQRGMLYILFYEKKGECYDRLERFQLSPNMWDMSKKLIVQKVPPGKLIAIQQLYSAKDPVLTMTSYTTYTGVQWIPIISQPGKRYYFAVNYGVREVPADYPINADTTPAQVFSEFKQAPQPNWDAHKICQHLIGGS